VETIKEPRAIRSAPNARGVPVTHAASGGPDSGSTRKYRRVSSTPDDDGRRHLRVGRSQMLSEFGQLGIADADD
jgi:hypothetical protein